VTRPALGEPPDYVFGPLTRTDIVRYAGASGDFNPLHHDHAFARAAGLSDVMAHGMLSAGLLGSFLATWARARPIRRFKVRFRSPVWPGDTLRAEGEVAGSSIIEARRVAHLILRLRRQDGTEVVSGEADVECDDPALQRDEALS